MTLEDRASARSSARFVSSRLWSTRSASAMVSFCRTGRPTSIDTRIALSVS